MIKKRFGIPAALAGSCARKVTHTLMHKPCIHHIIIYIGTTDLSRDNVPRDSQDRNERISLSFDEETDDLLLAFWSPKKRTNQSLSKPLAKDSLEHPVVDA